MHANNLGLQVNLSNPQGNMYKYSEISMGIVKCIRRNTNIIIIPFILYGFQSKDPSVGHANILIYRRATNVLEHFEPHGSYYGTNTINRDLIKHEITTFVNRLNTILKTLGLHEVELIESSNVCPYDKGLQTLEAAIPDKQATIGGYCVAWSMFFTELALANPTLSSREILEIVYNKAGGILGGQYLKDVIEGYSNHISNKLDKYYSILFNKAMTTVEIQCRNDNATPEELRKIDAEFHYIRDLEIELLLGNIPIKQKILNLTAEIEETLKNKNKGFKHLTKKLDILEKMDKLEELQTPESSVESVSPSLSLSPVPKQNNKTLKKTTKKAITKKNSPNPKTANKVKICPEGSYLNLITNRCNKIPVAKKNKP